MPWTGVEASLTPLTAASRGVAIWLGATLALIAALTAARVMRPAFPNEPGIVAFTFGLGALVGILGMVRKEPRTAALSWAGINVLLAVGAVVFAVPLGLAPVS